MILLSVLDVERLKVSKVAEMRRSVNIGMLLIYLVSNLSSCNYIIVEADKEKLADQKSQHSFYQEGDVIEEDEPLSAVNDTANENSAVIMWEQSLINSNMYNIVMELKNNGFIGSETIYLNKNDERIISIYDVFEAYDIFKDKKTKSGASISFHNNDELAVLLGLQSEEYLLNLRDTESITEREVSWSRLDKVESLFYDKAGEACSEDNAVISFYTDGTDIFAQTESRCIASMLNFSNDDTEYLVFVNGVEEAQVIGNDVLVSTSDAHNIYINVENFISEMNSVDSVYLNKLSDFLPVYGFAVNADYIMSDFSMNTYIIAEMYTYLDVINDWSEYVPVSKHYTNLSTILKKYVYT